MTDLVQRLPFPPQRDESMRGLVVRIAEDNLCGPHRMADWMGISKLQRRQRAHPIDVAAKLKTDPAAIAGMGLHAEGGETVMGQPVATEMISALERRYCPSCLGESPYQRRLWEHRQISSCPFHGCELLDYCPECRDAGHEGTVRWGRGSMLSCDGGHRLARQVARSTATLGSAAVHRAFGLPCDAPSMHPSFEALPGQALLDVLIFLGRMEVVVAQRNPDGIPAREMETSPALLEAGAWIAMGWPQRFHDLCGQLRRRASGVGAIKAFGHLHRFVRACGGETYAALLREAYAAELVRFEMPESHWPDFMPMPDSENLLLSTSKVEHLIGMSLPTEPTMLVPAVVIGRNRYFRRSEVIAFSASLKRRTHSRPRVTRSEETNSILGVLGLSRRVVRQISRTGFLDGGRAAGARSACSLEVLFEQVVMSARDGVARDPLSFGEVVELVRDRKRVASHDVAVSILSGDVQAWVTNQRAVKTSST